MATSAQFVAEDVKYTDDVPVITQEFLNRHLHIKDDRDIASKFTVSGQPEVFTVNARAYDLNVSNLDVRIWRKGLPEVVQEFVACALEVIGPLASKQLDQHLSLNEKGELIGSAGYPLDVDRIADLYTCYGVNRLLAANFAAHFLDSVTKFLQYSPEGTNLSTSIIDDNLQYSGAARPYTVLHTDSLNNATFHYSDPGTPYFLNNSICRTQVGDVSVHGNKVYHGFATSRLNANGSARLRFLVAYKVLPGILHG